MKILNLINITPGGHHAWYMTDLGFKIRKPLGFVAQEKPAEQRLAPEGITKSFAPIKAKAPWYRRLLTYLKNLFV